MENWIHQIYCVNHCLSFDSLNKHPYSSVFQALLDEEVQIHESCLGLVFRGTE